MPLGGVGDIANYGSSEVYDLEEAFLSADDEELGDIVTETTRARVAQGPAWLTRRNLAVLLDGGHPATDAAGFLGITSRFIPIAFMIIRSTKTTTLGAPRPSLQVSSRVVQHEPRSRVSASLAS